MPFGDLEAIRSAFTEDRSIGTLVLETVQGGGGIIEAPTSFWQGVRRLCDEFGVLWIAMRCNAAWAAPGASSPSSIMA